MNFREELMQALARGYTHERNKDKEMDVDLLVAMADEVTGLLMGKINVLLGENDGDVSAREGD